MSTIDLKERKEKVFDSLKEDFGYTSKMAAPKIEKVVISCGVGSKKKEKKFLELIRDRLTKITGQKPVPRGAKKSIATFRIREGDVIGYQVTLRKNRADEFLNKFLNVAIPRMRDFRGLDSKVDEMGNLTVGVKEHIIFPETLDEEVKDVFGFCVTITTTAKDKKEGEAFFNHLNFPFKKKTEK